MAKKSKSLGYVHLEWTCPNCDTKNPGPQKTCTSCGYPQPDDVKFEQAAQEEIITDEAEIARAKAGPDVHCHYCGTRNAADAKACSQCGADLSEGAKRASGQVLGAHRTGPAEKVTCAACDTENEPGAARCVQCGASLTQPRPAAQPMAPEAAKKGGAGLKTAVIAILGAGIVACVAFFVLFNRTEDITGTVQGVSWQREIVIEALQPVTHEDWRAEIPAGAPIGGCRQKVHHTQDDPAPNAKEICSAPTQQVKDTGTGLGEVVEVTECHYEVYADWCEYTVDEWQATDTPASLQGSDFNPQWPSLSLINNQREGKREETYRCIFDTADGQKTYNADNLEEFQRCQIGSEWILSVNTFNTVRSMEPAK